jgi:hypothetical protein
MARRSQSSACFFSFSTCPCSFFSSAIAAATSCLVLASWLRASISDCSSTLAGSSARPMSALMFALMTVINR